MTGTFEGLPAAISVQQAICLAQLQILRRLERQRNRADAVEGLAPPPDGGSDQIHLPEQRLEPRV